MLIYSCPYCSNEFTSSYKDWNLFESGLCPRCNKPLKNFPAHNEGDERTSILKLSEAMLPPRGFFADPIWDSSDSTQNKSGLPSSGEEVDDVELGPIRNSNIPAQGEPTLSDPAQALDDPNLDPAERFVRKIKLIALKLKWLLFSFNGRIGGGMAFLGMFFIWGSAALAYLLTESFAQADPWILTRPLADHNFEDIGLIPAAIAFFWTNWAITLKRFHDFGSSIGAIIVVGLFSQIPYIGNLISIYFAFFKGGTKGPNKYGSGPGWINRPR